MGWFYWFYVKDWMFWVGEFIGIGIIGVFLLVLIMVWFWIWIVDGNYEVLVKVFVV